MGVAAQRQNKSIDKLILFFSRVRSSESASRIKIIIIIILISLKELILMCVTRFRR